MHALPTTNRLSLSLSLSSRRLLQLGYRPRGGGRDVSPLTNDRGRVCAMRVDPEIAFIYERYMERYRRRDLSEKRFTS